MTAEVATKKIEKITEPTIHIRVRKNITYFVNDNICIAVTTAKVVNRKKKEKNEDLA